MTEDEIIAVVQEYRAGKRIEVRVLDPNARWQVTKYPTWNFFELEYRVAPEPRVPRELWLQDINGGLWQEKFTGYGVHFREVIEEKAAD